METSLGEDEQNTQITATDDYSGGLSATHYPSSDNNGNSLPPTQHSSGNENGGAIATEVHHTIWYDDNRAVMIPITELAPKRYFVIRTSV